MNNVIFIYFFHFYLEKEKEEKTNEQINKVPEVFNSMCLDCSSDLPSYTSFD